MIIRHITDSLKFGLLFSASLLVGCTSNTALHPQTALSGGKLSALQSLYDVQHYELRIEVLPERKFITGIVGMQATALANISVIELDLDPRFEIRSVSVNDSAATFQKLEGKLLLTGVGILAGDEFSTSVSYQGRPYQAENAPWDGGFVWSKTPSGEHWIATAVQGRGCDLYWPCKDHISDKPDRGADMHITVPNNLVAVMNGVLVSEQSNADKTTYFWRTTNPISAYHLAINIGPFKQYEVLYNHPITRESSIPIIFYHVSNDMDKIKKLIADDFVNQLEFFERMLGPYPWGNEKIGIVEIPYLGMEHQTMNGYGNQFALDPLGFDWLMQHEFSHEWFGNLMTQAEERDFWLHEGFASYMQPLYAQQVIGDAGYWSQMWKNYNTIQNCKPVVPEGQVSADYFDSNDVYYKGEWTLHTLRWLIGEEAFWRSVRRLIYGTTDPWSLHYPIQPINRSTEDFIEIVNEEFGEDLSWFFDAYLKQATLPILKQERNEVGIRLSWPDNPEMIFDIPALLTHNGQARELSIPTNGELFPLPTGAILLVDPQVKVFRDFGTLEGCQK